MTYKIYNRPGSAGMAIEATLELAGIEYQLENIQSVADRPTPESFRQINPWGQVPALILPNGDTLTEVPAMLIHLATAHPDTAIGPAAGTAEGAQFARWTIFAAVNVHEAISRRTYPYRFTDSPEHYAELISAANKRLNGAMSLLEQAIEPGPFLFGKDICAADIYFAMFVVWCRGAFKIPRLQAIENHVRHHEKTAAVWARHTR